MCPYGPDVLLQANELGGVLALSTKSSPTTAPQNIESVISQSRTRACDPGKNQKDLTSRGGLKQRVCGPRGGGSDGQDTIEGEGEEEGALVGLRQPLVDADHQQRDPPQQQALGAPPGI